MAGSLEWHAVKSKWNLFGGAPAPGGAGGEVVSSINLASVTAVARGIQTDVMRRARLVDPLCSLSVVTDSRTLDMTLASPAERDLLLRALKAVFAIGQEDPPHQQQNKVIFK